MQYILFVAGLVYAGLAMLLTFCLCRSARNGDIVQHKVLPPQA